jgi:hypothetical protein
VKKKIESTEYALDGVIIPSLWDEDGQVIAVSIAANDEHDYIIENGDKFFKLVGRQIHAEGMVETKPRAQRTIKIKRYEIIESSYS